MITLPTGMWTDQGHLRHARVREVTGVEELRLARTLEDAPVTRADVLLAACATLEGAPFEGADGPAALTVGDRNVLLLRIRAATFGQALRCAVSCAAPGCGEHLELDLRVDDLILPPHDTPRWGHRRRIVHGDDVFDLVVRPVTGLDLMVVAAMARLDVAAATEAVAARCVRDAAVNGEPWRGALPESVLHEVAEELARLDPQADVTFDLACPACGRAMRTGLDPAALLLDELDARAPHMDSEVHALCGYHGWSLAEVLGLSAPRRRRFVELIEVSIQEVRAA